MNSKIYMICAAALCTLSMIKGDDAIAENALVVQQGNGSENAGESQKSTNSRETNQLIGQIRSKKTDFDRVNKLLDAGALLNARDGGGRTLLTLAARSNKLDVAKILVERGADIDESDNDGDTPLIIASRYGDSNFVRFLLEEGAYTLDAANKIGLTPLMSSAFNADKTEAGAIAQLLIDAGVSVFMQTQDGKSVLDFALTYDQIAIVTSLSVLSDFKVEMNRSRTRGQHKVFALDVAIYESSTELVALLLKLGAKPDQYTVIDKQINWFSNPLNAAVNKGRVDVVKLLLDAGAGTNGQKLHSIFIFDPLVAASREGNPAIVKLLLDAGFNPNQGNEWDGVLISTPLDSAISNGKTEVVSLLVNAGANVNTVTLRHTPLDKALSHGNPQIIELLRNAGAKSSKSEL